MILLLDFNNNNNNKNNPIFYFVDWNSFKIGVLITCLNVKSTIVVGESFLNKKSASNIVYNSSMFSVTVTNHGKQKCGLSK